VLTIKNIPIKNGRQWIGTEKQREQTSSNTVCSHKCEPILLISYEGTYEQKRFFRNSNSTWRNITY